MFGSNSNGECMKDGDGWGVVSPFRIDEIIERECNTHTFDVYLGFGNTKILCEIH